MWLFLLLSSWILFSQWRASLFRWEHRLRKRKEILLAAMILWHCPVAVPWCHNNLSYPEQGRMNLTCLSASVALFHRQNVGQGATTAMGPTDPRLHNSPNTVAEVLEWTWEKRQKNGALTTTPLQRERGKFLPLLEAYLSLSPSNLYLYTSLSKMRNGAPTQGSIIYLNSMN